MASGRGQYILHKRPPAPSPDEKVKKQKRADGLAPQSTSIISAQRDFAPLEDWDHAGSGGRYMAYKNAKLQQQYAEGAAKLAGVVVEDPQLFRGVAIHVNGLTNPSHLELKQIMALHGGRFENYYSRSTVTHIICSNLTDAKVKIFEKERHPKPFVRPEWITDSLKEHRLLSHEGYVLQRLRGPPGQKLLAAFEKADADAAPVGAAQIYPQAAAAANIGMALHTACKHLGSGAQSVAQLPPATASRPAHSMQKAALQDGSSRLKDGAALQSVDAPLQDRLDEPHPHPRHTQLPQQQQQPDGHPEYDMAYAQQVAAQKRAACDVLRGQPRSSRDDPQFMETFFKASRLHFIGTWKARIEQLMAELADSAPSPAAEQPNILAALKGSNRKTERVIMHLDMDCFFASIASNGHPAFAGKPLAVCHSNSAVGSAEISSCNYPARAFGVKAGMGMARAKTLCPNLLVLPYEFDKYEEASEKVYRILLKHTGVVQPLSCDEAFLDISGLGDPLALAAKIRQEVFATTQCTASAGIGPNLLIARLATKRAKPDGVCRILAAEAQAAVAKLPLADLPGVGWSLRQRLDEMGLHVTADVLHMTTRERLQRELGEKTGANLWDMAHARDGRVVQPPQLRKSLGAECNWGIRFRGQEDAEQFLVKLAGEVTSRLTEAGVQGRTITLKLKRKQEGAPEPSKFLGHGICDNVSRSVTLPRFVSAATDIATEAQALLRALRVPPLEIRGIGILVSKLSSDPTSLAAKPSTTAIAKGQAPPVSVFDPDLPHPWASAMVAAVEKEKEQQQRAAGGGSIDTSPDKQRPHQPWADAGLLRREPAPVPASIRQQPESPDKPFKGPMDHQLQRAMCAGSRPGMTAEGPSRSTLGLSGSSDSRPIALPSFGKAVSDGGEAHGVNDRTPPKQPPMKPAWADPAADEDSRDSFAFGGEPPTCNTIIEDGSRDSFAGFGGLTLQLDEDSHSPPLSPVGFPLRRSVHDRRSHLGKGSIGVSSVRMGYPEDAGIGMRKAGTSSVQQPAVLPSFLERAMGKQPECVVSAAGDSAPVLDGDDSNAAGTPVDHSRAHAAGSRQRDDVSALPSPSQLDQAVLDSLPLAIKRELELAYGLARASKPKIKQQRQPRLNEEVVPRRPARAPPAAPRVRVREPPVVDAAVMQALPDQRQQELRDILANPGADLQMEAMEGPGSDDDEGRIASDPWQAMPWEQAPAATSAHPGADEAPHRSGGIDWAAAGVPVNTVPEGVLNYLSCATADEGCQLLSEWAGDEDGCPGIISDPVAIVHTNMEFGSFPGNSNQRKDGSQACAHQLEAQPRSSAEFQLHQEQCRDCSIDGNLCGRHAALCSVLVAYGHQFVGDLEALWQVMRCIGRMPQQSQLLRGASDAAVAQLQEAITHHYGGPLRLATVLD